ncbi:MAG: hypothetical protein D6803_03500 [Anaerolineae bacterium]|nr:MAG: hypothetical protein D6803_03500 [Anaerolineae bacterium]
MQQKHVLLIAIFLLAATLSGCISFAEDITPPPGYQMPTPRPVTPTAAEPLFPATAPNPLQGRAIFAEKCAPCHGETGLGNGPDAANLPNPVAALGNPELARQATPAEWFAMVSNGNLERYMPPFKSLSAPQRWDVVAYALTLSVSADELAQGEKLYAENCTECHGENGQGDGPKAASLSSAPAVFTDQAYMSQISAAEMFTVISQGSGEMPAFGEQLSEAERWALTAYLRQLSFASAGEPVAAEGGPADSADTPAAAAEQPAVEAQPAGTGTIDVSVVNPAGGDIPVGQDVTLYAYENMEQVFSQTAPLGEDGHVIFTDLPMRKGLVYVASTEYGQMPYGSNLLFVADDTQEAALEIQVFDTTTDRSQLVIERAHMFIDFGENNSLQVVMLLLLANRGQQTVIPPAGEDLAVVFEMPPGARDLSVQNSMQLRYMDAPDGNGFGIASVRPSPDPYEVTYAFSLPYDGKKTDVTVPLPLDTLAAIVIAPQEGVRLKSDQLISSGTRDLQGTTYATFTAENIQSGEDLRFTISGLPRGGTTWVAGGENNSLVIGLSVFGLALIATGVYLWRRSHIEASYDAETADLPERDETVDDLLDAILALDNLYKQGEIPEEAYRRRRGELKARLQQMLDGDEEA